MDFRAVINSQYIVNILLSPALRSRSAGCSNPCKYCNILTIDRSSNCCNNIFNIFAEPYVLTLPSWRVPGAEVGSVHARPRPRAHVRTHPTYCLLASSSAISATFMRPHFKCPRLHTRPLCPMRMASMPLCHMEGSSHVSIDDIDRRTAPSMRLHTRPMEGSSPSMTSTG